MPLNTVALCRGCVGLVATARSPFPCHLWFETPCAGPQFAQLPHCPPRHPLCCQQGQCHRLWRRQLRELAPPGGATGSASSLWRGGRTRAGAGPHQRASPAETGSEAGQQRQIQAGGGGLGQAGTTPLRANTGTMHSPNVERGSTAMQSIPDIGTNTPCQDTRAGFHTAPGPAAAWSTQWRRCIGARAGGQAGSRQAANRR
jgi:hypothetical protein